MHQPMMMNQNGMMMAPGGMMMAPNGMVCDSSGTMYQPYVNTGNGGFLPVQVDQYGQPIYQQQMMPGQAMPMFGQGVPMVGQTGAPMQVNMQQQPGMMQQQGMQQPQMDGTADSRATSNNSMQPQQQQQQMGFAQQQTNSWGQQIHQGAVSPQMPMQGMQGMVPGSTGTPGPPMPPPGNAVSPVPPAPGHAPNAPPQLQHTVSPTQQTLEDTQRQTQIILQQSAANTPQSQGAMRPPHHQNPLQNVPLGANPHPGSGTRGDRRPSIASNDNNNNSRGGIIPPPPPKAAQPHSSNIAGKAIPPAPAFAPSANNTSSSGINIPPPPPGPVSEISGGSLGSSKPKDDSKIENGMNNMNLSDSGGGKKQPEVAPIAVAAEKKPVTPTAANSAGKSSGAGSWAAMAAASGGAGSKGPRGVGINMDTSESAAAAAAAGDGKGGGKDGAKGKGKGQDGGKGWGGKAGGGKGTPKHSQTPKRAFNETPCQFHARGKCHPQGDRQCQYSHDPKDFTHEKFFELAQDELNKILGLNGVRQDHGSTIMRQLWVSNLPHDTVKPGGNHPTPDQLLEVCAKISEELVEALSIAIEKRQKDFPEDPIQFKRGDITPQVEGHMLSHYGGAFCFIQVPNFNLACHLVRHNNTFSQFIIKFSRKNFFIICSNLFFESEKIF